MDYKKLGLRVGLEIHKQIESHKLFCSCPSELRDGKPDLEVKRVLRAVVSETGEKDKVAEFEMSKGRYAIYQFYKDSCCLVELDEEPCHPINKDALKVALTVGKLLNCSFVDELVIMRKQVLDYSNTSSFQRTGLYASNGYIKTKSGKFGIENLWIEEEAARIIKDEKDHVVYRLDRLGIPLIEIATAP
ncbi:MAG: Glu-tRNA(Gln) amidotransferase GatDE subunit E, partial [Nanoarchaeota archaeon]